MSILGIVLAVLKIIGIVLLCVLGLFILVLLAVLFIPIRYRLFVSSKEEERIRLEGRITWALFPLRINGHLVGTAYHVWVRSFGLYVYDSDYPLEHKRNTIARLILKKLGFDDTDNVETKQEKKLRETKEKVFFWKKKDEEPEESPGGFDQGDDLFGDLENLYPEDDHAPNDSEQNDQSSVSGSENDKTDTETTESGTTGSESFDSEEDPFDFFDAEEEAPKKDIYDHIMYFFDRLNEGVSRAEQKLEELTETCNRTWKTIVERVTETTMKIKVLIRRIRFILKVLEQDCTKKLLKIWCKNIWKMFCHVLPTKCKGWVHFGFPDDPQKMGKILAFAGAAYSLYGRNIEVRPDFAEKVIEGEVTISGRIRIFTMLFRIFRMLVNIPMVKLLWFLFCEKTGRNDPKRKRRRGRKRRRKVSKTASSAASET